MSPIAPVESLAHAIQLAVAPVFLLTGIGSLLGAFTQRLSRIINRARALHEAEIRSEAHRLEVHEELLMLSRRARLTHQAIALCIGSALLVATVIGVIFLGLFVALDTTVLIAACFLLAMLAFIAALLSFLREVQLATRSLRIGPRGEH